GPIDLGTAAQFGVFALQRTVIDSESATVDGSVGVSRRGALAMTSNTTITGDVDKSSRHQVFGHGNVGGSVVTNPELMNQADTDALAASAAAKALTPNQSFRHIHRPTTVTGNGGLNVIEIRGGVTASVTLDGSADDVFVVNIRGDLRLHRDEGLFLAG